MIELKETYGYQDFMKNYNVVLKYRAKDKLTDEVNLCAELDCAY